MTTTTVESRITRQYLMNKTKDWLASEYLRVLDQLDAEQKLLSNLLAVIHRDGGQYEQGTGTIQATYDAIDRIHNLRDIADSCGADEEEWLWCRSCKHSEDDLRRSIFDDDIIICNRCGAVVENKKAP